ncbi:nuclease EXOG, mitochondrial isoform X2 [Canis lupus baileyi]|nr:nuclease EXOG, mitochondrial isoform X2 [Canis lupus dingo]XP_038287845.1 nuclease EXOG, mitochondrial isoform X2 [Canis lupus familiaris]XP_038426398.1 nuclease EXOG, mitochondrial isoform X2 [Canis lupus familiaris]XP_542710.4 nuclease EXOG, mitochondrial isoform X2 [Canis lupus familiaris]|eukprot:XP_542710.4 nuclease EXOG, mitochondrial isoform X2 [Canis lupus familiaris]
MRASVPRSRLASRRQSCCAHARPQKAGAPGMAAKSFASRLGGSGRSLGVFVAGAAVGAAGGGFAAVQWLERQSAEAAPAVREPDGDANRKHCKFKPDPNIPPTFSAFNEDYIGSGWSRGHMAPAGNNKFSSKAMAETFYLSNIVPQNFDNNAGYWNRIEMYCRELTERFEDVWIVSGPLTLPQTGSDGKKTVSYQVIGEDNVAVPSHLYKVILARRSPTSAEPLALGAFVVPNEAIGFQPQLNEFQVSLQDLEKLSGLVFFPHLDRTSGIRNICSVDTCKLLDFQEFTLYLSTRKIEGARSVLRLEKIMEHLKNAGIEPDDSFMSRYKKKLEELQAKEQAGILERNSS